MCILDFPGGPGYPAELHPGCWPVPRPGGHSHLVGTAWPPQTHHYQVLPEPAVPCQAPRPPQGPGWGCCCQWRGWREWVQGRGVAFRLRGPRVKRGWGWGDLPTNRGEQWEHRGAEPASIIIQLQLQRVVFRTQCGSRWGQGQRARQA